MNTPGYMVYWMEAGLPQCSFFEPAEMSQALTFMNDDLRNRKDVEFVTFSGQHADRVGKDGVTSIVNGMIDKDTPYEWSKKHRGMGPRKEDA